MSLNPISYYNPIIVPSDRNPAFALEIRHDDIQDKLGVSPIRAKLNEHHLRLVGHVQLKPHKTLVHSDILVVLKIQKETGRPILI
jgi:hypothetical protein